MFLISPYACVAAVILELALYLYLRHRAMEKRWGDVRAGLWVALARFALLQLGKHGGDPRNWRPQILLFAGDTAKRISMVRLACWFNQNRGLVTACQLVKGDLEHENPDTELMRQEMNRDLEQEGLVAFSEVNVVSDFENGVIDVAQANGIADLQSNTVMFGWPKKRQRLESQLRIMRALSNAGKSTIIAHINWSGEPGRQNRIDLWWGGLQNNGDLMLLLAYLLRLNHEWNDAEIFVRSIARNEEERISQLSALGDLIPETRINAETEVILKSADHNIADIIQTHSRKADVVFLGLMVPEPGAESEYAEQLTKMVSGLGTTIFVRNSGEFAGHLI